MRAGAAGRHAVSGHETDARRATGPDRDYGVGKRFFGRDFASAAGLGGTPFNAVPSLGSMMAGLARGGALLLRD